MSLNERMQNFYLEYLQGVDPQWIINKHGFNGLLQVDEVGRIYATSTEGRFIIRKMREIGAQDVVKARQRQSEHHNEYPWVNPAGRKPHAKNNTGS